MFFHSKLSSKNE